MTKKFIELESSERRAAVKYMTLNSIEKLAAAFNPDSARSCKQVIAAIKEYTDDGNVFLTGGLYTDNRLPSSWQWESYEYFCPLAYGSKVVEEMRNDGYLESSQTFKAVVHQWALEYGGYDYEGLHAYREVMAGWSKKQIKELRKYALTLDDQSVLTKAIKLCKRYGIKTFDGVKQVFDCICGNDTYVDFGVLADLNGSYSVQLINIAQDFVMTRILRYYGIERNNRSFNWNGRVFSTACTLNYLSDNYEYNWGDDFNINVLRLAIKGIIELTAKESEDGNVERVKYNSVEKCEGDVSVDKIELLAYCTPIDYYVSYRNSVSGAVLFKVLNHTFKVWVDPEEASVKEKQDWVQFKQVLDDLALADCHLIKIQSRNNRLSYIEIEPNNVNTPIILNCGPAYRVMILDVEENETADKDTTMTNEEKTIADFNEVIASYSNMKENATVGSDLSDWYDKLYSNVIEVLTVFNHITGDRDNIEDEETDISNVINSIDFGLWGGVWERGEWYQFLEECGKKAGDVAILAGDTMTLNGYCDNPEGKNERDELLEAFDIWLKEKK